MVSIQNFSEMFSLPKRCKLYPLQDFPTGTRSQSGGALKVKHYHYWEQKWFELRLEDLWLWEGEVLPRGFVFEEMSVCVRFWSNVKHATADQNESNPLQVISKIARHPTSIIWIRSWLDDWLEYYSLGVEGVELWSFQIYVLYKSRNLEKQDPY